jgi:pilus assembly protein CpaD
MKPTIYRIVRTAAPACALTAAVTLLAACSSELASFDDTYVPQSVEENYPIKVVEKPVKLQFQAKGGGLQPADANAVIRFAAVAAQRATTPVTIGYASGSKLGRRGAEQTAAIVARQGVALNSIFVTPRDGWDNDVTLSVGLKVAETKPCGDWSQNLRGNQFNESGPNFGCTVQQNMAAMVSDPQDFEHHKPMTPALTSAQSSALDSYASGRWTVPVVTPSSLSTQ